MECGLRYRNKSKVFFCLGRMLKCQLGGWQKKRQRHHFLIIKIFRLSESAWAILRPEKGFSPQNGFTSKWTWFLSSLLQEKKTFQCEILTLWRNDWGTLSNLIWVQRKRKKKENNHKIIYFIYIYNIPIFFCLNHFLCEPQKICP